MTTDELPPGFLTRPARDEDKPAVAQLLLAVECATFEHVEDTVTSWVERLGVLWQVADFDLPTDSRLILDPTGQIIGYVTVVAWRSTEDPTTIAATPRIHPAYLGLGIGTELSRWAELRARQIAETLFPGKHVVLSSWSAESNLAAQMLLAHEGFEPYLTSWTMVRETQRPPAEPLWPQGISVRSFVRNQDEHAVYQVITEAFASQGGVYLAFDDWCHLLLDHSRFDPSLWLLATNCGEIVGTCPSHLAEHECGCVGEIDELAVHPGWRGRGIAHALLLSLFRSYYQRDITTCTLGVDAANPTGAVRVYERAGMQKGPRVIISYRKMVQERL